MMRRARHALPDLRCEFLHRALTLREHVDDLGASSTPKRRRHRRERVKQGGLRGTVTHKIKLSFELIWVNQGGGLGKPPPRGCCDRLLRPTGRPCESPQQPICGRERRKGRGPLGRSG